MAKQTNSATAKAATHTNPGATSPRVSQRRADKADKAHPGANSKPKLANPMLATALAASMLAEGGVALDPSNTAQCRCIVRGRKVAGGPIGRAVRSIDVPADGGTEGAMQAAQAIGESGVFDAMGREAGFVQITTRTVYPPVGLLCRGGVSKGFGTTDSGDVVFVSREHKAGAPAPKA